MHVYRETAKRENNVFRCFRHRYRNVYFFLSFCYSWTKLDYFFHTVTSPTDIRFFFMLFTFITHVIIHFAISFVYTQVNKYTRVPVGCPTVIPSSCTFYVGQRTVPPQTDSTHARSYTTYSTHNSSFTGLLLHNRGPTRSCYVWHRQSIQHVAFLHMLRYSTRPYCTAPNSPQTDSTRPWFNTTCFYTSVFLHKAGPVPPFPVFANEYISGR